MGKASAHVPSRSHDTGQSGPLNGLRVHTGSVTGRAVASSGTGPSPSEGGWGPEERRVLVVEDDAPVRAHAVRLIRQLGYAVRDAGSGAEALRLLAVDPHCDILFTDVVMPGMSGGELAEAARLLLPRLAIVFVTGHHADPCVERLRREERVIVLMKPYRREAVARALRDVS